MSKVCVFIIGTNAVGKSTLARELLSRRGGVKNITKLVTYCKDGKTAFGGSYGESATGCGVDKFSETKILQPIVREALLTRDVVICEGVYLHTFGLNLTNAIFEAEKQMVVFLYCPVHTIHERLLARAGRGITNTAIGNKQICCSKAVQKWAKIGVPVLCFDTSKVATTEIADQVDNKIRELCGESTITQ